MKVEDGPANSIMFTVEDILERISTGEITLTVRTYNGPRHRMGREGEQGYVKEKIHLVERHPDNYVVEYVDGTRRTIVGVPAKALNESRWTFARYMPRACARIIYEIEKIEFRPLESMTEADAKRAGSKSRAEYMKLWDTLNNERGYGRATKPNVRFVYFKVVEARK